MDMEPSQTVLPMVSNIQSHSSRPPDAQRATSQSYGTLKTLLGILAQSGPPMDAPGSTNWGMDDAWPLSGHSSLSADELRLFSHYHHHVAPWVSFNSA